MNTFDLEALGNDSDSASIRAKLVPFLSHTNAVMREGAIYGIARRVDDDSMALIRNMATNDPSDGVRTAAQDLIWLEEGE
jgi:hypothetical protein